MKRLHMRTNLLKSNKKGTMNIAHYNRNSFQREIEFLNIAQLLLFKSAGS